jgi:hypothetical protein
VDCANIDEQVVRPQDDELKALVDQFVCVRVTRMNDVDIGLFQFDYDLTWACFFLDGNDRIYSRYGGRDGGDAEGRISVAGLKHTMRRVLADHQAPAVAAPPRTPTLAHQVFTRARGCMHCHNVWEGLREQARAADAFTPEMFHVYPLPENIGLKLDAVLGNVVKAVAAKSASAAAGLRPGDVVIQVGGVEVRSQGDVMHALHLAPVEGNLELQWRRDGEARSATIALAQSWKKTDLRWRRSMRGEPMEP